MAENGTLSPKQIKALAALLSERTIRAAAKVCNVPERTLYRWLAESADFRAALVDRENQAMQEISRGLLAIGGKAVRELESVLDDACIKDAVKIRASDIVLARLLTVRELATLEARIAALERARNETNLDYQD